MNKYSTKTDIGSSLKLEKYQSFDQILIHGIAVDMAGWICIPFVTRAGGALVHAAQSATNYESGR